MKKITILGGVLLCFIMSVSTVQAQDSPRSDVRVKQRMLLNQFESDYVLTANERVALKQARLAYQYRMKELLDSIDISEGKRRRLLQELKRNPLSEKVQAVIANHISPDKNIEQ